MKKFLRNLLSGYFLVILLLVACFLCACSPFYSGSKYVVKNARGAAINSIQRFEGRIKKSVSPEKGSIFENIYHLGNPINIFNKDDAFWFIIGTDKVVGAEISRNFLFRRTRNLDISNYN